MSSSEQILAPRHPPVGQMSVKHDFDSLEDSQKLYAHHMARYVYKPDSVSLSRLSSQLELPSMGQE